MDGWVDGQKKDGRKERGKKTYFSSKILRHCSIIILIFEVSNDNYITKIFLYTYCSDILQSGSKCESFYLKNLVHDFPCYENLHYYVL